MASKKIQYSSDPEEEKELNRDQERDQQINQEQKAILRRSLKLGEQNMAENNNGSIDQQLRCSSKQVFVFLGVSDSSKEIIVNLISGDQRKKSQQLITLENSFAIIKYPIDEELDFQKKIALWNDIITLTNDRQLTFALILDQKQLFQSKELLNKYLQSQFQSLQNSVSDVNLLLQLKFLAILISQAKQQNNRIEDELIQENMKQLKEYVSQIYWEYQKKDRGYRQFLFYLIQIFSPQESFLKLYQGQKSSAEILVLLQKHHSVDPKELMIKPPKDVLNKTLEDLVEKIMKLDLLEEHFEQFNELFSQLSLEKQKVNLQDIYTNRLQICIQQIQQFIDQIKKKQDINQYNELLQYIKLIESFEQYLSHYNLKSILSNNQLIESIQEILQIKLICKNLKEKKDFLIIVTQFSGWNKKFQDQEISLKEQIGYLLNITLKDLSDRNGTQNFSSLTINLQDILEIFKSSRKEQINDFISRNTAKEIVQGLEDQQQTCCQILDNKIYQIQNNPNFKTILKDLQFCQSFLQTLKILSNYQSIFEDILKFKIQNSLQEIEEKKKILKQNLQQIKENLQNNQNFLRAIIQEKTCVVQVYEMFELEIELEESQIKSYLNDLISKYLKSLNEAMEKKIFNDQFIINFIEIEKNETKLNNNLIETKKMQNKFKSQFNQFLEQFQKINTDDNMDLKEKSRLRQEKINLQHLKQLMKFKNEPAFLTELLNKLPNK